MAYSNGAWLAYNERQARIDLLTKRANMLRKLYKAGEATEADVDTLMTDVDELARLRRVHRAEHDVLYFAYEYFSEAGNPGNPSNLIPEGQSLDHAAYFHRELCDMLDAVTRGDVTSHIAWSVGRNHAKTAYLSNVYLAHQLVFRHQQYIVEVSETTDVAGDFITWTRYQLKFNEKLRQDFGSLMEEKPTMNELDNKYAFVTSTGSKVEAKGVQTQMRGLRYLNARPGLFILDDLESNDNTNTKELREKNLHWFQSEMMEALGFGGICVYLGTIIHYDSLLNHVLQKRRDFKSRSFPAITSWSSHEELWQRWRDYYNEDRQDAKDRADAFYEANKGPMLQQAEVLWPERFSYKKFMEKREDIGARAFNQEYLGNPVDEETQVFDTSQFYYFRPDEVDHATFDFFGGIDFAMGKQQRGDFSVYVILARNRNTGVCYVWDVFIGKVHPDKFMQEIAKMTLQYQPAAIAVEAQAAQEFFADKLTDELQRLGYPAHTRLKQIKQRTRKELRIEALLPDIMNGGIRFQHQHRELLEQFELYPNHNHDDGPDSLSMAFNVANQQQAQVRMVNKRSYSR